MPQKRICLNYLSSVLPLSFPNKQQATQRSMANEFIRHSSSGKNSGWPVRPDC